MFPASVPLSEWPTSSAARDYLEATALERAAPPLVAALLLTLAFVIGACVSCGSRCSTEPRKTRRRARYTSAAAIVVAAASLALCIVATVHLLDRSVSLLREVAGAGSDAQAWLCTEGACASSPAGAHSDPAYILDKIVDEGGIQALLPLLDANDECSEKVGGLAAEALANLAYCSRTRKLIADEGYGDWGDAH